MGICQNVLISREYFPGKFSLLPTDSCECSEVLFVSSILVNPQLCGFIILMAARNRADLHSVALSLLNYRKVTQLCA